MTATTSTAAEQAQRFVEAFAAGWSYGERDAMIRHFRAYTRPETRFSQPMEPDHVGPDGLAELFGRVYALIPDLRGRVHRYGPTPDGVIIELELTGTLGGRPVSWRSCDRITLDDEGRIVERQTYFDPTRLLATIASRPKAWRRWWASAAGPPRRRRRTRPSTTAS